MAYCLRLILDRLLSRRNGDDSFHVGGVVGFRGANEGILAVRGHRQEFLGGRTTHRSRGRVANDVLDAEGVEDPLVGLTVQLVGLIQAFVGHVEGVGVLHDELTAAQDASARAGLIAILGLDLVENLREILIGVQLPLDEPGEQLLVGGTE